MKFQSSEGTAEFTRDSNKLVVELVLNCSRENKFETKNRFLKELERWISKTHTFTLLDRMVLFQLRKKIHNSLAALALLKDPDNGELKTKLQFLKHSELIKFTNLLG